MASLVLLSCSFVGFPLLAWETGFLVASADDVPAWQPTLYTVVLILLGLIAFYITYRLIEEGRALEAHRLWIFPTIIAFAVLGFNYKAFLAVDNDQKKAITLHGFFSSHVFYSLIGGFALLFPALLGKVLPWYESLFFFFFLSHPPYCVSHPGCPCPW